MSKKGQGLSLNVIIVAAIALIVMVILIAIFTGRVGFFEKQVSEQSQADLALFRLSYADCHPTSNQERSFIKAIGEAQGDAKDDRKAEFKSKIRECELKGVDGPEGCSGGCEYD